MRRYIKHLFKNGRRQGLTTRSLRCCLRNTLPGEEVAKILKVPVEAIKKLDDATAVNIISNTFNNNSHDSSSFYSSAINYLPSFNPIDKVVQLYAEKIALHERMLKDKE